MRYLKNADKQQLLNWIDTVYQGETIRTGMTIPQPGCSYGESMQDVNGDWCLPITASAEAYVVEPYASMVVENPVFPAPVDPPFPL